MTTEIPKHTPAPWTVEEDTEGLFVRTPYAGNHDEMMAVYIAPSSVPEQREADANLIAAAPELLEVAERVRQMFQEQRPIDLYQDVAFNRRLLDALAKAHGEV